MGCVNSHPIKHPKKPLPTIPSTNNVVGCNPNGIADRNNSFSSVSSAPPTTATATSANAESNYNNTRAINEDGKGKKTSLLATLLSSKAKFSRANSTSSGGAVYEQRSSGANGNENAATSKKPNNAKSAPAAGASTSKVNKTVIAIYAYEGRDDGELSFEKNDKLVIVNDSEPDWWLAYKLAEPEKRGYIPMNFIVSDVIETEEWFFSKTSRREAERLLLYGEYPRGSFLIRNSEQESGAYSLSVRDFDALKLDHVKHYKIHTRPNGDFYITSRRSFVKLQDLIEHYSMASNGLCHRLTKPCPKVARAIVGPSVRTDEIDRRDLKLIRELGSGNFGKVYYGIYRGQTQVAIKTLKPGSMSVSAFMQEAAIMRRYRHDKLVPLYGVCSIGQPLLIITEYMSKGSLLNYLNNHPEAKTLTIMDLIDMASQIASGMAYLEKIKLVHRDLAARNVLVGDNKIVKVADFGLARIIEEDYYIAQVGAKFPIKWTAPEAAKKGKFTSKSDVWSFGVLLYEMITMGETPYPGMVHREVLEQVERGYRMPKPRNVECPNSIYQIMLECWDRDPEKRPTFEYLHSYFDDFFVATEPRYRDANDYNLANPAGGGGQQ